MSHLNYFELYISKNPNHEDQLTRAFLVLLRYSNSSLFLFYDMMYQQLLKQDFYKKISLDLPSLSELNLRDIQIETQVSEITDRIGQFVVSVLLSDVMMTEVSEVTMSERGFCYDAVITFPKM